MSLLSFPNAVLIFGLLMLFLLGIEQNIRCKDRVNQLSRRKPLEIKEMRLIHFAESSYIEYWTTKICFEAFYGMVINGGQVLTDPSLWSQGLAPGGDSSAFIPPSADRHQGKGVARGRSW